MSRTLPTVPAHSAPTSRSARFLHAGRAVLVLGLASGLAACGHSAPTQFFTLDPVAPATAAAGYAGPAIKVLAVHIPPALDREELISEGPASEVRVHDFEHWEAPLGETARQTLVQDLAARLPAGAVVAPSSPGGAGVALLSADVVSFQLGAGGATMQAAWSLTLPSVPLAPQTLVWRSPIETLQAPSTGAAGGQATAEGFSALVGQLADRISTSLPVEAGRLQAEQAAAVARTRSASQAGPRVVRRTEQTTVTRRSGAAPG